MRMSKTHKVVVTAVVTTIATATVLTFTRGDTAEADRFASLPVASNDSPIVATRSPGHKKPKPSATTSSPKASDPATQAPKPAATTSGSKPTTKPGTPTTEPAPAPSPTPTKKSLLQWLLGQ
jgi:hypothetical protein